ncbi:MAG: cation diffusion facilitator family transporter [Acidobacteriota bacterium]
MAKINPPEENESKTAIFAAIIGNLLIAVTKFAAAAFTGSSAMLTEGIHSVVDTGNGVLMLYGLKKSAKPPDEAHPFGHGRELYFWTLIVAVSIFGVGGGVSIFEGITHILNPVPIENPGLNYAVLGASFVFEGVSWMYGWRAFSKTRKGKAILETIHVSKDPTSFTVVLEDTAALIGLAIAFFGVLLGHEFGIPHFDGAASILIGALLWVVALFLGYESKSLLVGEAVDRETLRGIRTIAEAQPEVEKALKILTIYSGPNEVVLTLELDFADGISAVDLRKVIRRIENLVKEKYSDVARVYYEAESLSESEIVESAEAG